MHSQRFLFIVLAIAFVLIGISPKTLESRANNIQRAAQKEITFSKDVAPIFYKKCIICHRPGNIGPMSLITYKEARPWSRAIKEKLLSRQMPPSQADQLTVKEIDTIVGWVYQGAKEGNYADLPDVPVLTDTGRPLSKTDKSNETTTNSFDNMKPASRPEYPGGRVEVGKNERRIALIIGNGLYKEAPLRNPVNDARAIATALREFGFDVTLQENLPKREMEEQVRIFGRKIKTGAVGLFYFSGHGIQVNGRNYLIPIGHNIEKEQDIEFEAVDAGRVLAEMEAAENRLNIVILDACRNNPFARAFRSETRGLAIMTAPSGSIVAYSTGPGSIASDGDGENGLYTQELLNNIRQPGLRIEDIFKRVRVGVKAKSNGKQVPWETSALEGDFYFERN